ncbi:MAG: terpene cyclase/mutase family protein [Verrucomicrobiae bacterium]|nr:terpene cyclase/mutase family protein [Verrucomicrobiae bacterium]
MKTISSIATLFVVGLAATGLQGSEEPEESPPVGPTQAEIEASIDRGLEFLLANQNANGSWGSAHQTKGLNIYAPVPGAHDAFRAAVTAMGINALIESGRVESRPEVASSLERAETFLLENLPKVRRATADAIYNVWTHGYGIQALVRMHEEAVADGKTERAERIKRLIDQQVTLLSHYESVDGGWGYYDFRAGTARPSSSSISFTTATMLVAFREAETRVPGVDVPDAMVDRAIKAINRQRKPDNSYLYGEYLKARPMYGINRPGGSLGRSQACNIALRYWGDKTVTDDVLEEWLDRLRDRNGWLSIGRKRPIPHESWFSVAGYFYYYGHYYAALCVEDLPESKAVPHREMLAGVLLSLQEKDGSWWDYPFYSYHQPYGTAFAIMTLARCRTS